jgi:hypothetical protein
MLMIRSKQNSLGEVWTNYLRMVINPFVWPMLEKNQNEALAQ